MTDKQPGSGWVPWLGLGVVFAAVGCCAAAPVLGAAIAGAGVGGALAGAVGTVMLVVCAVTVTVLALRRLNQARRKAGGQVRGAAVDRDRS
jgi:cytochrome c biogenesis protein CcdA